MKGASMDILHERREYDYERRNAGHSKIRAPRADTNKHDHVEWERSENDAHTAQSTGVKEQFG